jgi:hypothetical protein
MVWFNETAALNNQGETMICIAIAAEACEAIARTLVLGTVAAAQRERRAPDLD